MDWSNIVKIGKEVEKLGVDLKSNFGKEVGDDNDTGF